MGRKSVLTHDKIIQSAFELCSIDGVANITIRNIAKNLNTSTAPIYTQYANRDEILSDLDEYIENKLFDNMLIARTENPFFNFGIGILDFVLNNRRIVSEFYFNLNRLSFGFAKQTDHLVEQMKHDKYLKFLEEEELVQLLEDMRIYTFGLVATICSDEDYEKDIKYYFSLLENIGEKLTNYYIIAAGKMDECQHLYEHEMKRGGNKS